MKVSFEIKHKLKDGKARAGVLKTPHGDVPTPAFVPVGTQGTVKSLNPRDLKEIGVPIVLANTYHLHLRPGEKVISKLGGLAKWMGWDKPARHASQLAGVAGRPTMTDSGGFQVFSLGVALETGQAKLLREDVESKIKPRLNKITEEGATFQSHIDGSTHKLTPESSIEIQEKLGADLIVGFDDLESPAFDYDSTKESLERTNRWLLRSRKAHKTPNQLLYGVTHGGKFEDLRIESAKFVNKNFDAIALGGAHSSKKNMYEVIDWTLSNVSDEKPRHQLGIGEVDDIFEIIERGIDTFDCVIPTRMGRMGHVFAYPPEGNIKNRFRYDITKSRFAISNKPLAIGCKCYVCTSFSRSYVNHLFRSRELLGYHLATYHNVYFVTNLVSQIRESILDDSLSKLKEKWL